MVLKEIKLLFQITEYLYPVNGVIRAPTSAPYVFPVFNDKVKVKCGRHSIVLWAGKLSFKCRDNSTYEDLAGALSLSSTDAEDVWGEVVSKMKMSKQIF